MGREQVEKGIGNMPENHANTFVHSATIAISDIQLQTALDRGTTNSVNNRIAAMGRTTNAEALRQQGRAARLRALHNMADLLEKLEAKLTARGVTVLWAENAAEANQYVLDIAHRHNVKMIAKSKSMVTEETGLNHVLEADGIEVVETDLGEFIVQLGNETPSHIVMPIMHKTKEQVADIMTERLGMERSLEPSVMAGVARRYMREKFITADMGISGGNFLIAETGTLVTVTNEGNGRMCTSLPRVHVAVVGIERVVETLEDFGTLVQTLPRSATGQQLTAYVHMMSAAAREHDPDGPESMYVILLDNGRTAIHGGEYAEVLACVRCGACQNICPVYQRVGGHTYGWVYAGPIGAVLTPLMTGLDKAKPLPHASSLCGACKSVCPVDIDLPGMLLKLRADQVEENLDEPVFRFAIKGWSTTMQSPRLYELSGMAARIGTGMIAGEDGAVHKMPGVLGNWTQIRDFPPFAQKSFRQLWRERQKGKQ
jgi:L-lactate dehydrogenase complex protein LldF